MALLDDVRAYNAELRDALAEMWAEINKGQQKKILKNHPRVAALLDRFGIEHE